LAHVAFAVASGLAKGCHSPNITALCDRFESSFASFALQWMTRSWSFDQNRRTEDLTTLSDKGVSNQWSKTACYFENAALLTASRPPRQPVGRTGSWSARSSASLSPEQLDSQLDTLARQIKPA